MPDQIDLTTAQPPVAEQPKRKPKTPEPKTAMITKILEDPATSITSLASRTENVMSVRGHAWRRYRAKYRLGLQYLSGDMGSAPSLFIANYIHSNVESVKSNVGRSLPKIVVEAFESDDNTAADLVTKLLLQSVTKGGLLRAQRKVVHHGAITGLAWFKPWFNPEAQDGMGGNVIDALQPEDVLVDPLAVPFFDQDWRTTARYIIHRRRDVPWDEIEATYDLDADKLFDDEDTLASEASGGDYSNEVNDARQKPFGPSRNTFGKVVDVLECWLQTYEPFKVNEQTGELESSPWYIITVAGNQKLKAGYSPYAHGKAPFIPWFDGEDDGAADFYHIPIGEVEEIEMLQDKAAMLDMQIYRNIRMTVNRQRIINRLMGLNKDLVDNKEGRTYEVSGDPRLAMVWDSPPQLGNDVYTYRSQVDLLLQNVSGVTDVMSGRKPTGIAAAKAISALQSASQARIVDKQESLIECIRMVSQICMENLFQFYDTERVVRLLGGATVRVLGDYPPELQPGHQQQMEPGLDPNTGAPMAPTMPLPPLEEGPELNDLRAQWKAQNGIDLVLSDVDARYDITVSHGSPLPEDKGELGNLALDLFRLGAIDRKGLLDVLEWTDRAEIVDRLNAQETGPQAQANAGAQAQTQADQAAQLMAMMGQGGAG